MTSPFIQDSTPRQSSGGPFNAAPMSTEVQTFNWLLDSFTSGTAGVVEAIAVSADGLLMAASASKERANAERLAAIVSGMTSLASGASASYNLGGLNRVIVDLVDGYLLITAISAGSVLGVIATRAANLSTVAYEMTLFASRAGAALTPQLIAELKNAVQR
ncbi:roadblock/LC7 domain-containing protein [Dactylosporangium maewongense]|uniref:Roadblock/LC7 domain-containing protein n=1 Tax=Dactylosporangium maewongense TaxID=634393 RepID=A0ABP4ND00_9ACTN